MPCCRPLRWALGDMAAARKAWLSAFSEVRQRVEMANSVFLAYRTASGLVGDFHAFRHTYLTLLDRPRISRRVHQELARHSPYRLIERYTHARLHDRIAAANALSDFLPSKESQRMAATGTDGRQKDLGPNLDLRPAILRDSRRQPETEGGLHRKCENHEKQAVMQVFQGLVRGWVMGLEPTTFRATV